MTSDVAEILTQPYSRVIVPDGTGRFAAEILEFPGCFAEGDTPEEAYEQLERVAESWLENALAQSWRIAPPLAANEHKGVLTLRLPKDLHRRAAERAQVEGVSLNQFILFAVAEKVGSTEALARIEEKLDQILTNVGQKAWIYGPLGQSQPHVLTKVFDMAGLPSDMTRFSTISEEWRSYSTLAELQVPEAGG